MSGFLIRYVALGDSTGVGVGARDGLGGYVERLFQRLRKADLKVGLLNLAVSGATSNTLISGQLQRAVSARPTLTTVGIGVNDLWRGTDEASFESNLARICETLARTGTEGVLLNLPDVSLAPVARLVPRELYTDRLFRFNESIAKAARAHRFELVDLFTASHADLPSHPEYFCSDGFHPSSEGYARWTEHLWPTFERIARAQHERLLAAKQAVR